MSLTERQQEAIRKSSPVLKEAYRQKDLSKSELQRLADQASSGEKGDFSPFRIALAMRRLKAMNAPKTP